MVKSNLAVLLAERGLKITKVSEDTRISRTTLTALYYNHCLGVQFDTVNTLCMYLGVTPGDLFVYVPFDFSISECTASRTKDAMGTRDSVAGVFVVNMNSDKGSISPMLSFDGWAYVNTGTLESATIFVGFTYEDGRPEELIDKETDTLINAFKYAPVIFFKDFEQAIREAIREALEKEFPHEFDSAHGEVYGGIAEGCEIELRLPPEIWR